MKLIIDIPEEEVNECKRQVDMIKQEGFLIESLNTALKIHVANGTPLPKGHGRLIDADYLKNVILLHNFHGNNKNIVPYADRRGYRLRQREVDEAIINSPTIIEADTESEVNNG